jgi:hypothetical protein
MKIRIIKKIEEDIEEEAYNFINKSEFELACHNNAKGYSSSQIDILTEFHNEIDHLRIEVQNLKKQKAILEAENQKLASNNKPLNQVQLFHYCSHLNSVSKGKFGEKK